MLYRNNAVINLFGAMNTSSYDSFMHPRKYPSVPLELIHGPMMGGAIRHYIWTVEKFASTKQPLTFNVRARNIVWFLMSLTVQPNQKSKYKDLLFQHEQLGQNNAKEISGQAGRIAKKRIMTEWPRLVKLT